MKLLLDESLPHAMRLELPGHEVFTVAYMNWNGVKNGELLQRAAAAGFDALITNDRGMEYQQNAAVLPLAVVVMLSPSNTIEAFRELYTELFNAFTTPTVRVREIASSLTIPYSTPRTSKLSSRLGTPPPLRTPTEVAPADGFVVVS